MPFSVVDVEGDKVLPLNAGAVLVVDPDIFPFKTQLEEFTLGDGDLHLSMLTVHLCLNDVVITCQTQAQSNTEYMFSYVSGILSTKSCRC